MHTVHTVFRTTALKKFIRFKTAFSKLSTMSMSEILEIQKDQTVIMRSFAVWQLQIIFPFGFGIEPK